MNMEKVTIVSTMSCAAISLLGSFLILLSYFIARTKTKPKAAMMIRNLALCNLVWFLGILIESSFWINDTSVPAILCYFAGPITNFFKMASLIWMSVISFNVLMSVTTRRWLWKGEEDGWNRYRIYYYMALLVFAFPLSIANIVAQQVRDPDTGCFSGYEYLGPWWEILLVETIPICLMFAFNVFVCLRVYNTMAKKTYPQSVRKRRRRIMYHFSLVFVICWTPTILYYILQIAKLDIFICELISRITLYSTGFLNFVVFGLQDPHLRRSALYLRSRLIGCCLGVSQPSLIEVAVEKSVMFDETAIKLGRSSKKSSRSNRFRKLSDADKMALYAERPDLDPDIRLEEALLPTLKKPAELTNSDRSLCSEGIDLHSMMDSDLYSWRLSGKSSLSDRSNPYTINSEQEDDLSSDDEDDDEDKELKQPIRLFDP